MISYLFLAAGPVVAASWIWHYARKSSGLRRWTVVTGSVLFAVGWTSFMGASAAASGVMNWLPPSFDWPVGWTTKFIRTSDGGYAVAHESVGRVQLYDEHLLFLRGWQTETRGGGFTLTPLDDGGIEVHTYRGSLTHTYDALGTPIPTGSRRPATVTSVSTTPSLVWLPTPWWGWTLTTPGIAWGVGACGMGLLAISIRKPRPCPARTGSGGGG